MTTGAEGRAVATRSDSSGVNVGNLRSVIARRGRRRREGRARYGAV